MQTAFQRILLANLALVLGSAVVLRLLNWGYDGNIGFALMLALAIVVLVLGNLLLALIRPDTERKRAHWLSLLLVLLIGFGACYVGNVVTH